MGILRPGIDTMADTVRETVFDHVVRACEAAGMPQGFIDALEFRDNHDGTYSIINDWSKPPDKWRETKYPLAKWHEYGTDEHWIAPRGKAAGFSDVLVWQRGAKDADRAQAIYSRSWDPEPGETIFSKGHYVRGIPAVEPMHRGFKIGVSALRQVLSGRMVARRFYREPENKTAVPGGGVPF